MLGNDVVDLLDPESRPESFRPRFDERVFSPDERWAIANDPNPLARRWAHWAAKEAAYKLARQIDSKFVFSPGRLIAHYAPVEAEVGPRLERRGHLLLEDCRAERGLPARRIALRSFETAERIHVVAVPEATDWGAVDHAVDCGANYTANYTTNCTANYPAATAANCAAESPIDPVTAAERRSEGDPVDSSVAVRRMAIAEIGRRLGVSGDRLSIGRRGRIPTILLDGTEAALSLSLSHHGKWIGYAMALRMDTTQALNRPAEGRATQSPSLSIPSISQPSQATNRAPTA